MSNPRDHGYGHAPKPNGPPRIGDKVPGAACPNCRCASVFGIEVEVSNPSPLLRRPTAPHKVVGRYVGCPACPWASPMITAAELLPPPEKERRDP